MAKRKNRVFTPTELTVLKEIRAIDPPGAAIPVAILARKAQVTATTIRNCLKTLESGEFIKRSRPNSNSPYCLSLTESADRALEQVGE